MKNRIFARVAAVSLLLGAPFVVACAPANVASAPAAPRVVDAVQQLPVDLDVVLRVDLKRMEQALPTEIVQGLRQLLVQNRSARIFDELIHKADQVWIGLRPSVGAGKGAWTGADYVVILEGDFTQLGTRSWENDFYPARELGGGYRRFDAKDDTRREEVGRVYELVGRRYVIASSAEADALERVIERNRYERSVEPQARGVISFAASTGRLAQVLEEKSPRAARFLATAEGVSGFVDLSQQDVSLEARLLFSKSEDADKAASAFRIVGGLLQSGVKLTGGEFSISSAERAVVLHSKMDLATLAAWLGLLGN